MIVLVLISCVVLCNGAVEGNVFTSCLHSDRECMVASANAAVPKIAAGLPDFGIRSLDPAAIATIRENNTGLFMVLENTVVNGLRRCTVLDLRRQQMKIDLEIKCSLILTGDYVLKGKLLMFPIEGEGDYRIKIQNIVVKIHLDIGEKIRGGEKHWSIQSWKHSADVKGYVNFLFKNLFHGKEDLSRNIHDFANQNWLLIFNDIGGPVVREVVSEMLAEVVKIFNNVPINELSLD